MRKNKRINSSIYISEDNEEKEKFKINIDTETIRKQKRKKIKERFFSEQKRKLKKKILEYIFIVLIILVICVIILFSIYFPYNQKIIKKSNELSENNNTKILISANNNTKKEIITQNNLVKDTNISLKEPEFNTEEKYNTNKKESLADNYYNTVFANVSNINLTNTNKNIISSNNKKRDNNKNYDNYFINFNNSLKTIKVNYVDFWHPFDKETFDIHLYLKSRFNVIVTDKDPDFVIYSMFGSKHLNYKNAFKMSLSLENRFPRWKECDYALGLHEIENPPKPYYRRFFDLGRIPIYNNTYNLLQNITLNDTGHLFRYIYKDQFKDKDKDDLEKEKEKENFSVTRKFCAWVVSNGGFDLRNMFFKQLSKYKLVDSGGGYRNNIGIRVKHKCDFVKFYKFSIAFENSKTKGYCTEKLFQAFNCGTVPLYFGSDSIVKYVNKKSFVLVKRLEDFDKSIQVIKEIDLNDEVYEKMRREIILVNPNQEKEDREKYKVFLDSFFALRRKETNTTNNTIIINSTII